MKSTDSLYDGFRFAVGALPDHELIERTARAYGPELVICMAEINKRVCRCFGPCALTEYVASAPFVERLAAERAQVAKEAASPPPVADVLRSLRNR